jgi:hypothetical protein
MQNVLRISLGVLPKKQAIIMGYLRPRATPFPQPAGERYFGCQHH